MSGQHRPEYRKPRTGEKRHTRRPFAIDKLSEEVRGEIQKRRAAGEIWQEISDASAKFAGRELSIATLQRWYDVRVEQVQADVAAQVERSKVIAATFAGKGFDKLPEAVQTGLSNAIFALAESSADSDRAAFLKSMKDFAWLLARNRQLDQEDKRLLLETKKLESVVTKVQSLKKDAEKKKLTSAELAKKLDEIYDIAQPAA